MLSIHKYIVGSGKIVEAPVIHWLKVDYQERERRWVAWALIDLDAPYGIYEFKIVETGAEVDPNELKGFSYIDTVNLNIYVAHFFVAEIDSKTGEVMVEEDEEESFNYYNSSYLSDSGYASWQNSIR